MDFSFVEQSLQRKDGVAPSTGRPAAGPASTSQPAAAPANRRLVAIPGFKEVQRAEAQRQTAQNLFRPSGLSLTARASSSTATPAAREHAQQPLQQQLGQQQHLPQQQQPGQHYEQQQQQQQQQLQAGQPQHFQQQHTGPLVPTQQLQGLRPNAAVPPTGPRLAMPQYIQGAPPSRGGPMPAQQQQQQQQQQLHMLPPQPQQQQQALAVMVSNAIIVSRRQQGNPLLNSMRNVRWQYGDIVPDYLLGANACALFLSLRYHLLHPDYIIHRIKQVLRAYRLTVLLVHIDVEDVVKPLADITKVAMLNDCTLVCAWSSEECARYLETFKAYENKPAGAIQERVDTDYLGRLTSVLTSVRGVNRNDAATLARRFGTFADMLRGEEAEFSACPGLGPTKVRRLRDTFNEPFRKAVGSSAGAGQAAAVGGSQAGPSTAATQQGMPAAGTSQHTNAPLPSQREMAPGSDRGQESGAHQNGGQQQGTQAPLDLDLDDDIEDVDTDDELMGV